MEEGRKDSVLNNINPARSLADELGRRRHSDNFIKSFAEMHKGKMINSFEVHNDKEGLHLIEENKKLIWEYKKETIPSNFFNIHPVKINYNPYILKPVSMPQGVMFEAREEITPENIGEFALPIVEFIQQTKPDFVIGVDRGARLFGLAVMMLYEELYGEFPTRDHKMHFRRISKSVPTVETLRYLRPDAERMHQAVSEPRILVLDDWVVSGRTRQDAEAALIGHMGSAQVFWGVMRGSGADISGNTASLAFPAWKDDPDILGLDYEGTSVRRIKSDQAIRYRQRMQYSIRKFAQGIKKREVSQTRAA